MRRTLKIISIPVAGLAIVVVGFIYDLIFAGLPYQDPTPEMQALWEFHHSIANGLYIVGVCIFLIGLVAALFIWKMNGRKV